MSNASITIRPRSEVETHCGRKTLKSAAIGGIVALPIHVNEPDAAGAMLSMAKVPHRETRTSIIGSAAAAHGVAIEFAET